MQPNDTPFPHSGDNFRTLARVDSDLELSLMVLELAFPVPGADACPDEELKADYAVAMAEFERQLGCTCTADSSSSVAPAMESQVQ